MKTLTSQIKSHKRQTKPAIPIQSILDSPLQGILDNTNNTDLDILDFALGFECTFEHVYFSQTTIANAIGRSRQYVNERIQHLKAIGLLESTRNAWTTNYYKVTGFIKMRHIADILMGHLPNLKRVASTLPLSLLMGGCSPHVKEGMRHGYFIRDDTTDIELENNTLPIDRLTYDNKPYQDSYPLPPGNGKCYVNKWGNTSAEQIAFEKGEYGVTIQESVESKPAFIIQGLKLSIKGRIELSCFDEETIAEAGKQMIRVEKTVRDYMAWMIGACTNEYRRAGKTPDYERRDFLREQIKVLGKLPLWVHASPEEIALFTPAKATPKRPEQWSGHIQKDDLVTVTTPPDIVQKNIDTLKKSPFLRGMDIARMFADESTNGEVTPMSHKRLQHQSRRILRDTGPHGTITEQPESIMSDKKELSNVIDLPVGQSFNQIERRSDSNCAPTMQVGVPQERDMPALLHSRPPHSLSPTPICQQNAYIRLSETPKADTPDGDPPAV